MNASAPARHLILAQSSLQFILASALAEETRSVGGLCRLLFLPDVLDPGLFARATDGWSRSPFDRIEVITPRRLPGQAAKAREASAVRGDIIAALRAFAPTVVTVFNDRQEAGQTVLIETSRCFPQALRCCAEDGALAYTTFRYRAHSALTSWRQKLRLGRQWADVQVLGTHPLVQRYRAIHPALLRPELRGHPVDPMPADELASASLLELAARLCALTDFDAQTLGAGGVLLTLSHTSYAQRNPAYCRLLRTGVDHLVARGRPFFFKYHPRETDPDYLGLTGLPSAQEVPRELPVECVYLFARARSVVIVGGMSTALLTAGLLLPRSRIAALVHTSDAGDAWDEKLLAALRITAVLDAAALADYLDAPPA